MVVRHRVVRLVGIVLRSHWVWSQSVRCLFGKEYRYARMVCVVLYIHCVCVCLIHEDVGVEIPDGLDGCVGMLGTTCTATEGSWQGGIPLAEGPGLKDGSEVW